MAKQLCEKCKGDGIVGQGDKPWLKEGFNETCKECVGTGKTGTDDEQEVAPEDTTGPVEPTEGTVNAPDTTEDTTAPVTDEPKKNDGSESLDNEIPPFDMTPKSYRILGEIIPTDEDGTPQAQLEIGSIHEFPVGLASAWVEKGLVEEVTE